MSTTFWKQVYREKARLEDPILQSGRGKKYGSLELLKEIRQALVLLELDSSHRVLNLGCANGLFDVALSACCRQIIGVEPVGELAELANQNLSDCSNAFVVTSTGDALPMASDSFDRVLIAGVIQLNPEDVVKRILHEAARILRRPGRMVLLSVPNKLHQPRFDAAYTKQLSQADHLSDDEKQEILERNQRAFWYSTDELKAWSANVGGQARVVDLPDNAPNADHRFDMIIDFIERPAG